LIIKTKKIVPRKIKRKFKKQKNAVNFHLQRFFPFLRAEDGAQTRDPQLGRLMLYRLSYFRKINVPILKFANVPISKIS
jgi:hypothetical protein